MTPLFCIPFPKCNRFLLILFLGNVGCKSRINKEVTHTSNIARAEEGPTGFYDDDQITIEWIRAKGEGKHSLYLYLVASEINPTEILDGSGTLLLQSSRIARTPTFTFSGTEDTWISPGDRYEISVSGEEINQKLRRQTYPTLSGPFLFLYESGLVWSRALGYYPVEILAKDLPDLGKDSDQTFIGNKDTGVLAEVRLQLERRRRD